MSYKLSNNIELPNIGYGTWRLKNNEDTIEIIKNAVSSGYRLFDTAIAYGNIETIGKGLKESKIKREELFITSKLWNDSRKYDDVIKACKDTIKKLDCKYLDLYLIHWPASPALFDDWVEKNNETWKAFEYLYEKGLVKAIGVCNFKVHQLEPLLKSAKIPPMVNQIEYHVGQTQQDIVDYCFKNNIVVEAWSPLGSGKMLKVEELQKIAEKYGVTTAQLCIKFCLQNNVLPIPKSKDKDRMKNNLDVDSFTISDEDMKLLNEMPYLGGSGLDSDTVTLFG
jgi:diketogulonate reductase-like aldo/keto reductase